jgi:FkbM family methyltransferase
MVHGSMQKGLRGMLRIIKLFRSLPLRFRILFSFSPIFTRHWAPLRSLSAYEIYSAFGGNDFYWGDIPPVHSPESAVVLGGYLGDSAIQLAQLGYRVTVFEPIPAFAQKIRIRVSRSNLELEILEVAAATSSENILLSMDGDGTSQFSISAETANRSFPALNFSDWIMARGQTIGLLEMNIEGGEYEILQSLISNGSISKVNTLLVQFHNLTAESTLKRNELRIGLSSSHRMEWGFDWVWEKWVKSEIDTDIPQPLNVLP